MIILLVSHYCCCRCQKYSYHNILSYHIVSVLLPFLLSFPRCVASLCLALLCVGLIFVYPFILCLFLACISLVPYLSHSHSFEYKNNIERKNKHTVFSIKLGFSYFTIYSDEKKVNIGVYNVNRWMIHVAFF